jgi:hypothetical protein
MGKEDESHARASIVLVFRRFLSRSPTEPRRFHCATGCATSKTSQGKRSGANWNGTRRLRHSFFKVGTSERLRARRPHGAQPGKDPQGWGLHGHFGGQLAIGGQLGQVGGVRQPNRGPPVDRGAVGPARERRQQGPGARASAVGAPQGSRWGFFPPYIDPQ